ncbi:MAG: methyltransferase domain-containing protein, partial [Bacteroidota bacterium]
MPDNYDKIAKYYDQLSRVVFGRTLIQAQKALLKFITPGTNILIIGGGTGIILEEISKIYSSDLTITYVEISRNMIEIAEKRNWKQNEVYFIHQPVEEFIS